MATDGCQRIDERRFLLRVPRRLARRKVGGGELASQEQDEAEEAEEARRGAVNCPRVPVALRLAAKVGACFLEGDLDVPPADIPGDDTKLDWVVVGRR